MKFRHLYHPNSVIYWKVQSHYLLLLRQQPLPIQRQKRKRKNHRKLYVHFQIDWHVFFFFAYFINKFNWIFSAISSTPEEEHSIHVTTRIEVNTFKQTLKVIRSATCSNNLLISSSRKYNNHWLTYRIWITLEHVFVYKFVHVIVPRIIFS